MLYVGIGLISGILTAFATKGMFFLGVEYSVYYFLIILALINSILSVYVKKNIPNFKISYCLIYIVFDIMLSLIVGYFSSKLGVPFYLVLAFVYGNNIYKNTLEIFNFLILKKNNGN